MSKDLILEIGSEELPPGFINPVLKQLKEKSEKLFKQQRLRIEALETHGTPRRLILYVKNLRDRQDDLRQEHLGPARRIAFDKDGRPTKAALGFARGKGKTVEDLFIKTTDKGEYVGVVQKEAGRETALLLPELLKELMLSLTFPKTMRWGAKSICFARPINWILTLYGNDIVSFAIDGIKSGSITYGHRWISPGPFLVKDAAHYFEVISQAKIQCFSAKRKEYILQDLRHNAKKVDAVLVENDKLLDVVNNLVEVPHAVVGSFNPDYLVLPDEVIIATIEEHQKCFALMQSDGKLGSKFIQISNSSPDNDGNVRTGSERVIKARLADARFFYEEDQKTPLAAKVANLKNVLYQNDLGTVYEKVERISAITVTLSELAGLSPGEKLNCKRAAYLAKSDLVTNMIGEKEFAKLQGFMGWKYAEHDREEPTVARAIYEHYLPRFADDKLPETTEGSIVALADKFDTIAGCFAVGIIPTGSQDPYALRRAALGIVRIILDREFNFSLKRVVDNSLQQLSTKLKRKIETIRVEVLDFLKQRLNNILLDKGFDYDIIEAVLTSSFDNLIDAGQRTEAIQRIRQHPNFDSIATANKRVTNILKKVGPLALVDESKFEQVEEAKLFSAYQAVQEPVDRHINNHAYADALELLVDLRQPIDKFFDHVFVMVEDPNLRDNRLALLNEIKKTFDRIADFSKIVVSLE